MKSTKSIKKNKKSSPALPGKPLSKGEYANLVREAEAGPFIDGDAFKKKWAAKLALIK